MTIEDAIKMLKAKLECMTRDTSGSDDDCNHKRCDQCHLNYEKGTMGEQKECLKTVIKALEQEPCEETISRFDMLDAIGHGTTYTSEDLQRIIKALPPVTPQPKTDFEHKAEIVISQLRADRDRLADAIEKIRAEISVRLGLLDCKRDILAIIDKYKVESEE